MTQNVKKYVLDLQGMNISMELLQEVKEILDVVPQVRLDFENPTVEITKKHLVIDRIFPQEIRNFVKILCDNNDFNLFDDIYQNYIELNKTPREMAETAQLVYVTKPTEEQLAGVKNFIKKELNNDSIKLELIEDASIKSGFILRVGSKEYDWSEEGRIAQLKNKINKTITSTENSLSYDNIISILKTSVEDFELKAKKREIGTVKFVGDGIVTARGIDHACYGEIVLFDCGVKGMVQDIRREDIGIILFGHDTEIHEGSRVVRTGKMAGIPVGDKFKGRVVDALGAPLDGKGEIKEDDYRPIENPAPGIVDRLSVSEPMETGILSID